LQKPSERVANWLRYLDKTYAALQNRQGSKEQIKEALVLGDQSQTGKHT